MAKRKAAHKTAKTRATPARATTRPSAKAASTSRVPVAKTYKLYIDGKFPRSESGRYYPLQNGGSTVIANVCRSSRKDFRDAVVAARTAFPGWSAASAYLRGQILYRTAEMLEGRSAQFVAELEQQGVARRLAQAEVTMSIERLVHYAGWADKYQQIFSAVNPVASSHFNFSVLEPTGVVAIVAPEASGLLGLVSNVAPAVAGGNTCVVLASQSLPLSAVSFAEVLHASDFPVGVINVLTGMKDELTEQFASHMDVNAVIYCDGDKAAQRKIGELAADNIKRVILRAGVDWNDAAAQSPYFISDTQETKTTWHPIGV
ncbi:MAG TPA: aldehyde dehydrogenase family protein [Steroidobacteraceae bacterium]|nr:aldehyde dehydrogenase family protein [Steroidobacteraceae bacterium]